MPYNYYRQQSCEGVLYQIKPGDSFFLIAGRFGVSLQSLVAANPQIQNPAFIFPGQIICVPIQVTCPREIDGFIYTVLPGDTLFAIAQQFDVSVQDILNFNPFITSPDLIFVGQRICVPRPGVRFPCCAILLPVPEANLSDFAKGSLLIQTGPEGGFSLTFAAVGLPDPSDLGDFNEYIGTVFISAENISFSALLSQAVQGDQPVTWAGTRIIPDNPQSPENILTVRAINSITGAFGPVLLRSFVGVCGT